LKIKDLIKVLELWAPPAYQESYDNSRLIVGNPNDEVEKCIVALDCVEDVVDEAIEVGAQIIVAHHPIVFGGLKSFTGKNYIERTVMKAIKNDIAIYAIHTNLDNVHSGVNYKIASRLGLQNVEILDPKNGLLRKLVTFVPVAQSEKVLNALFQAGAGFIGKYSECSFSLTGTGTFKAGEGANPHVGEIDERHHEQEQRVEVIYPVIYEGSILNALIESHPYEEVAYDLYQIQNKNALVGSGMVGELEESMDERAFMDHVKKNLNTDCIRHTKLLGKKVKRVAFCGGSGSFLLGKAQSAKADVFITGDFKYHQFFDAEDKLVILDVGHFESEQFTIDLIAEKLQENFPTFAVLKTEIDTNPISYY
jgi:dinuclear metal center YbgI/SA1388 family protein